jgi:hypothetical protein
MRILIDLPNDVLKNISKYAIDVGLSRKRFIEDMVTHYSDLRNGDMATYEFGLINFSKKD